MGSLKAFTLLSGQELLGEVISGNNTQSSVYVVKNPVFMEIIPDRGQIQFHPTLKFCEEDCILLYHSAILFEYKPAVEIQNKHRQYYGSGIVVPTI